MACLFALPVGAQHLDFFRVAVESRYDNLDWGRDYDRIQSAIRAWANVDLGRGFDAHVHTSTGSRFQSRWSTATDFRPPREREYMTVYVRQLYLQYQSGPWRVLGGTIPPIKNVASSTGLEPSGWVDGMRVEYKAPKDLIIETVVGGINDLNEPNMFTRPREFNFAEVELTKRFSPQFLGEISLETLGRQWYARTTTELKTGRGYPQVEPEVMLDMTNGTIAGGLGVVLDLNEWYRERQNEGLEIRLFYKYVDPRIGLRGTLSDDFYTFDHAFTVEMEGPLWRKASLSWFGRQIFSAPSRTTAGIRVNLVADTR